MEPPRSSQQFMEQSQDHAEELNSELRLVSNIVGHVMYLFEEFLGVEEAGKNMLLTMCKYHLFE